MSSDSDRFVFQNALEEQDNTSLFQAKRWTYVVDSSSSGGVFNSQLQFDLNTLSSQNQWTDLREAYIQFPVKVSVINNTTGSTSLDKINASSVCIKNGFHNFVDSVQLVLGGSTIQTSQIYTNVDASFKILTEWSQDELRKYGPTLGISLDELNWQEVEGSANNNPANVPFSTLSPGFTGVYYNPQLNDGFKNRADFLNSTTLSSASAATIISNPSQNARGMVQTDASAGASGTDRFVAFYLATIRLKDICDSIKQMPPIKNLKGYLYVNYNSGVSTYTTDNTGEPTALPTHQTPFGRCNPIMVDKKTMYDAAASRNVVIKVEISGVKSLTLTDAKPSITNARLYTPYFVASPEVDRELTQKKTFRYNERFVTTVNIPKLSSVNTTITPGISNPQRLTMLPILVGIGANASDTTSFLPNPEASCFDAVCGGCSSPFAALQQLQVSVGNQPMFQEPVNMDHQMFLGELAQIGRDGGQESETGSGLLSQLMWDQNYRYYTVDIGRRINGDDGASKSVQLSVFNPCNADMRLICNVWHSKEITVDTAMGTVVQNI